MSSVLNQKHLQKFVKLYIYAVMLVFYKTTIYQYFQLLYKINIQIRLPLHAYCF